MGNLSPLIYIVSSVLATAAFFLIWRYTEGVERNAKALAERVAKLEERHGPRLSFDVAIELEHAASELMLLDFDKSVFDARVANAVGHIHNVLNKGKKGDTYGTKGAK